MSQPGGVRIESAFDAGFAGGPRALLWVLPPAGEPIRAVLVCVQPFAEEANLSRRMIASQARRLAEQGLAVLVPDLYGTGDSAGEFEQATLAAWRDDLARAASIARLRTSAPLVLWGVRFGALLAAHLAGPLRAQALLAWHPTAEGGEPVAQFRRLARLRAMTRAIQADPTAPAMSAATAATASSAMSPTAAASSPIESGGYRIAPALVEAMQALRWPQTLACPALTVEQAALPFWQSLDAPPDHALFDATERTLAGWLADPVRGEPAQVEPVPGEPVPDVSAQGMSVPGEPVPGMASGTAPAAPADESMLDFESRGRTLRGVLHRGRSDVGVLIVPGQPQTRVGSHRMFVQLARALAAAGHSALRYDLAGFGDSDGQAAAFDATPDDVAAAAAALRKAAPPVRRVVLWGLCDGATAAALASPGIEPLAGLVLVNPWVHDESLRAKAIVGGHYRNRLVSADFWRRALTGRVRIVPALREAASHLRRARAPRQASQASPAERLLQALQRTAAPACLVLSGQDMTAGEMSTLLAGDAAWQQLAARLEVNRQPQADHTMSDSAELHRLIETSCRFAAMR